jgi:cytochrome c-type biogenesis protein CcmH/NrfG
MNRRALHNDRSGSRTASGWAARLATLVFTLALGLAALPSGAHAQELKDNKWTKDATKFLGLAALRATPEEKAPLLQQAMTALQESLTKEPQNAKGWFMAGQVHAQLDNYDEADAAFKKAEELHPAFATDIDGEREQLWLKLFQKGVASMDEQKYDVAIQQLEHAEKLYAKRPEALLNLGMLYTNRLAEDATAKEKAQNAFNRTIEVVNSPMAEQLNEETKVQWKSFGEMAGLSLAQLEAQAAIDAFQAQKFDVAAEGFRKALKINPHSRDFSYNLAQALYARVGKIEEARKVHTDKIEALSKAPKGETAAKKQEREAELQKARAEADRLATELTPLYDDMINTAQLVHGMDPNNTDTFLIQARAWRGRGELAADVAKKNELQEKALALLTANQNMPVEINDLVVSMGEGEAKLAGNVKSLKAKEGEPVKLRMTFLSLTGQPVGTQEVTIAAPAAEKTAPFEASAKLSGAVAGWKYEVVQ